MFFIEKNKIFDEEDNLELNCDEYETLLHEIPKHKRIPLEYFRFITSKNEQPILFSDIEPFLSKKLQESLFDFQKKAVRRTINQKRIINASNMGLGKSLMSLAALSYFIKQNGVKRTSYLIICPSSLKSNWKNELEKWEIDIDVTLISKVGAKENYPSVTKELLFKPGLKIAGYEIISNIFEKLSRNARNRAYFNTIIVDESHNLKTLSTKRYKMLSPMIRKAQNIMLLSGTPCPARPAELFPQLKLLYPDVFTYYEMYQKRYCDLKIDTFTGYTDDRGSSNLPELSLIFNKAAIRLRLEDFQKDLPTVTRVKEDLDVEITEEYTEIQERLDNSEDDKQSSFMISELFRETAVMKAPVLTEYFEWLDLDEKAIVFFFHKYTGQAITDGLDKNNIKYQYVDGETSMKKRTKIIDQLLNGDTQMLVCSFALSTGHNMVPIAKMYFAELNWSIAEISQAEKRIDRIGGAKNITYTYLCGKNTLDVQVFGTLNRKKNITNIVVDNNKNYGDFKFKRQKIE